jgi:ATP-dependent exoDNAse (exonuclease V) beta subunit
VTAEHVYILGVCQEALPGQRRDEYPGTDADYRDEQRRLFYVSITRAKRTLVISRALRVGRGPAKQIGLTVTTGGKFWADLKMSPFLHDVMGILPTAVPGDSLEWVRAGVDRRAKRPPRPSTRPGAPTEPSQRAIKSRT